MATNHDRRPSLLLAFVTGLAATGAVAMVPTIVLDVLTGGVRWSTLFWASLSFSLFFYFWFAMHRRSS